MEKNAPLFTFLQKTARGVAEIYEKDGRIYLSRFTSEQKKLYLHNPDFHMKTAATSGIRLEFSTSARKIAINGCIESGSSRDFYAFDIYVNGVMHHHIFSVFERGKKSDFSFETELPEGEKEVKVYFPQLACASVSDFLFDGTSVCEIGENAYTPTESADLKAIFFGDSITQGYDAYHPSFTYPAILSRRMDIDFINKGIGGDVHNSKVLASDSFVPNVIFVAYGTNDWNRRLTHKGFVEHIEEYHHRLRELYPDTPVIVFSPVWRSDREDPKPAGDFSEIYGTMCEICRNDAKVTVLDGMDFVAHSEEMFSDKKLHPNELGFFVYADSVCRAICERADSEMCVTLAKRLHF